APIADKGKGKANLKGQQSEVGSYHDTDIEDLPEALTLQLQGASRIDGGFMRHKAHGNVYNFADDDGPAVQEPEKPTGKVRVWLQKAFSAVDVTTNKDSCAYIVTVSTGLGSVLAEIAEKLTSLQENDCKVYVYDDDGDWVGKGPYSTAKDDSLPLTWDTSTGKYILNLIVEESLPSFAFSDTLSYRATPPPHTVYGSTTGSRSVSHSLASSAGAAGAGAATASTPGSAEAQKAIICQLLGIDQNLTNRVNEPPLHLAFAKYGALYAAKKKYKEMRSTWTGPRLTETDIVSLFFGK
ncbi:hypothetical protein BDN72DRAFT_866461, partial [Pluteus cervinus]